MATPVPDSAGSVQEMPRAPHTKDGDPCDAALVIDELLRHGVRSLSLWGFLVVLCRFAPSFSFPLGSTSSMGPTLVLCNGLWGLPGLVTACPFSATTHDMVLTFECRPS